MLVIGPMLVQSKGNVMSYLLFTLWHWALLALAIGFLTGWFVCSRDENEPR